MTITQQRTDEAVPSAWRRMRLWALAHAIDDLYQGLVPSVVPYFVLDRHYGYVAASGLTLAATLGSAVPQPIFGIIADRRNAGWMAGAGVGLAGLGLSVAGLLPGYGAVWCAILASGLGVAMFHPAAGKAARRDAGDSAAAMSLFAAGGSTGFFLAPALELRTPLAGLTAALEIAQQHPGIARDALIGELLAGHRRLSRTLNDLLVLAALDGRAQDKTMPVDLAGVVTDCSRRTVPDGVCLYPSVLERAVVLGNESQLSRMVTNLVDNALRYTRGKVELSVTVSRSWARLCVTDDGPGIPRADRERVWDRFVRLDDDRSQETGGSGLGLAIVREIAAAHGGETSVGDASPGPGAQFVVRLPVPEPE